VGAGAGTLVGSLLTDVRLLSTNALTTDESTISIRSRENDQFPFRPEWIFRECREYERSRPALLDDERMSIDTSVGL
jgi:hypothetical protein